jgi:hypothetical protein
MATGLHCHPSPHPRLPWVRTQGQRKSGPQLPTCCLDCVEHRFEGVGVGRAHVGLAAHLQLLPANRVGPIARPNFAVAGSKGAQRKVPVQGWQAPGGSCLWHGGRIGFDRGKIDEGKGCGQCRRPWARRARLAGEETLQGQGLGQTQRRASPRCCRFSQHVSVGRLLAHPAGPRRLREGPADRPRQAILEVRRPQDLGAQVCCGNLHVQCHTQGHTPPTIRMQTYGKGQVVNGPGHTAGLCETGQDTKEPGHDGARGGGLCRARQTGQTEEGKTYITSKLGMTPSAVKQTGKTGKTWGSVSG